MKPVCVRPIPLYCIVEFENYMTQMITMTEQCMTCMNHVAKSDVKFTSHTYTLCIGFSETCSCPAYDCVMHGVIFSELFGMNNNDNKTVCRVQTHVTRLKVKVTVLT